MPSRRKSPQFGHEMGAFTSAP
ncbi:hypothetical protein, partial [Mycobacterium tuberculosis]